MVPLHEKGLGSSEKAQNVSVLLYYLLDYEIYPETFLKVSIVLKIQNLIRLRPCMRYLLLLLFLGEEFVCIGLMLLPSKEVALSSLSAIQLEDTLFWMTG